MGKSKDLAGQVTVEDFFSIFRTDIGAIEQKDAQPPVEWIEENFIDPITNKKMALFPFQRRILRRALDVDDEGYSRYALVTWSQTKKSGKTTIAGAVGAYVGANVEPPNEVCCVANDQEQAAGRIYAMLQPTMDYLKWNGVYTGGARMHGPNGSVIKAITTRYEKEAGANNGLSLWSELWAYKSERLTRLWEEMTPPPTRRFSMRWVETYAGFKNESHLLRGIYNRIFVDDTEKELQDGVIQLWRDLPVFEIPDQKTLIFWDHAHRLPWQTKSYYISQKADLRPTTYARLHENRWVDSDDSFINEHMWTESVRNYRALDSVDPISDIGSIFAIDASVNGALTALVGTKKDPNRDVVITTHVKGWLPEEFPDGKIDYETVLLYIADLYRKGILKPPLYYDSYQLEKFAQDLYRRYRIRCEQFSQHGERIKSDTFLYKLYNEGKIANPPNMLLKKHVTSAHAKEYDGSRIRIVKPSTVTERPEDGSEDTTNYVDAAVSQSMSAFRCYLKTSGGWAKTTKELNNGRQ